MTAPNMETITASLERSLQNCSLNQEHHHRQTGTLGAAAAAGGGGRGERSSSSLDDADAPPTRPLPAPAAENGNHSLTSDTALELNSHLSLPYHWEQCLDLKTGEVYYINWRTGMKAEEDPRFAQDYNGGYYSEDYSLSDSEESSSESSPSSSITRDHYHEGKEDHVLVVAGCKSCLMYYMVPKRVEVCPKCGGQVLHFDRPENGSP